MAPISSVFPNPCFVQYFSGKFYHSKPSSGLSGKMVNFHIPTDTSCMRTFSIENPIPGLWKSLFRVMINFIFRLNLSNHAQYENPFFQKPSLFFHDTPISVFPASWFDMFDIGRYLTINKVKAEFKFQSAPKWLPVGSPVGR